MERDGSLLTSLRGIVAVWYFYLLAMVYCIGFRVPYNKLELGLTDSLKEHEQMIKVQLYSLGLVFRMWDKPHYRSPSFQQDLLNNLKNVAIPGTGIPLSSFCYHYHLCLILIVVINPIVSLLGAMNKARSVIQNGKPFPTIREFSIIGIINTVCALDVVSVRRFLQLTEEYYGEALLYPTDWFSLWQLNCRMVSYHSSTTKSKSYRMEDKWTFLLEGQELGVPVSPFLQIEDIVCKNKNVEGGLGIHFYKNALHGGDWIIQENIRNAQWLNRLLPLNSPLSTMRIITCSDLGISTSEFRADGDDQYISQHIKAMSSVLRLGRAGALTDHSSVLFDVDDESGVIKGGKSNSHWYKLGLSNITGCSWLPVKVGCVHPDAPHPQIQGETVPGIQEAVDIVVKSHYKMMPDVPIVGWDVAFTPAGICLLEVNLSCNFFKGTFDVPYYYNLVNEYFQDLEAIEGVSAQASVPMKNNAKKSN